MEKNQMLEKMTEETFCAKRIKLNPKAESDLTEHDESPRSSCTITAILSDEFNESIKKCFVYVANVKDSKSISKVMTELCQSMPLNELNHLKRVNKSKLILCSLQDMIDFLRRHHEPNPDFLSKLPVEPKEDDLHSICHELTISLLQFYMTNQGISKSVTDLLSEKIEILPVAAIPPILSCQYADAMRIWPCKFHPNKELEKLYTGTWFNDEQKSFHIQMIEICRFLRNKLNKSVCGIAVDPRTSSIVAIGFDEQHRHPLMHCAMVLIDSVARSQNGGAWNDILTENDTNSQAIYTKLSEYTESGVSPFVRQLISSKFPSIAFGAERVRSAAENRQNNTEMCSNDDNLAKYGPYLCTGYDVYLWREPCVMCSMALTHSRIRTIFFHQKHPNGAICSLTKLQSVKPLNHHFHVFHIDGDI